MDHPLDRVSSRLLRAEHHVAEFEREMRLLRDIGAYSLRREVHEDGFQHRYYIHAPIREPDPLSAIVSDCLHNLRSALDNLVYRLSELNLGRALTMTESHDPEFPICDTEPWFARARGAKYLSEAARSHVESLQPYNRSTHYTADPLWTLRELQNMDKHRFLVRPILDINQVTNIYVEGFEVRSRHGQAFWPGAVQADGALLITYLVQPPNRDLDLGVESDLQLVLDDGPGGGQPLPAVLQLIMSRVREAVTMARSLPECGFLSPGHKEVTNDPG
jgi:hypothetical protein